MNNEVCHEHSGIVSKLSMLESNISKLWVKWDKMQTLLVGTLISTLLSLTGVIFLLLRSR